MTPSSFRTLALGGLLLIMTGSSSAEDVTVAAVGLAEESGEDESGGEQPVEPSPTDVESSGEMSVVSVVAKRMKLGRSFYLQERRDDVAVENILDSEAIARAGDSNAATALKRVTGVTVVGGRFIYVRGLGERYSSTLLNGATIPSPDPVRRVVPVDLFPTGIIESIVVQKSYTQNLPAEFGGGAVELRTRSVPRQNFFEAEIKLGYNDGTTGEDGLRYNGGGSDWTGYDDGTRAESDLLAQASANGTQVKEFNRFTGEGYTPEELEKIGDSLEANYNLYERNIKPNLGFKSSGGMRFDVGENTTLGFLAAMNYEDQWLSAVAQRTDYVVSAGELEPENDFTYNTTVRDIDLSGFLTMGAQIGDNNHLTYNLMLLRNTTDTAQRQQGFNIDASGGDIQLSELEWHERALLTNQFLGAHIFPAAWDLTMKWQYTLSEATSDLPDTRTYRYDPYTLTPQEDDLIFSLRNDSNQRRWSNLNDEADDWQVNLVQPLRFWDTIDLSLDAGIAGLDRSRNSSIRRYAFISKGPVSGSVDLRLNPNPDEIIFDDTILPQGWQINEVTIATDAYTASQDLDAWYFGSEFAHEWIKLSGGVRFEQSQQDVITFDIFDAERNPVISDLDTDDAFLSLNSTFIFGDHQVRLNYGETINRPDFKELSPSLYKDPTLDRIVIGNPNLVAAYLDNYDLRWDYYFTADQFVSLGAFYKEFTNPIESVILAGAEQITTFSNAESAENIGIEFEFYTTLEKFNAWFGESDTWDKLYVSTNYAWIDSEITLSDDNAAIQTSDSRPLQGQSPYVWNFQLGYDDAENRINASILYNVFGERIVDVGVNGAPDIYEQPRPQLDFIYSQFFYDNWRVKFQAKNLLNPEIELTQGDKTRLEFDVGREYSISLQWSY
jgi:TonB-dependent receptor